MTLFFLKLSMITYLISRLIAKRTLPLKDSSFSIKIVFAGSVESLDAHLNSVAARHSRMQVLQKHKNCFLINEEPGLLNFGYFYFIEYEVKKDHLILYLSVQPKLVGQPSDANRMKAKLFEDIELKDVG